LILAVVFHGFLQSITENARESIIK
jgi:hypothetical protein